MSSVKFQVLLGSGNGGGEAVSYLLEFRGCVFLLDCGWDETFALETIQPIINVASSIDIVLLSHCDVCHIGALPYLVGEKKFKENVKIFATMPIYKMGQMFFYDIYQSIDEVEDPEFWDLDDVDAAFDSIVQLKFHQPIQLSSWEGLYISPASAGHTIGGSQWKISHNLEEILYAVDVNHQQERHLNGVYLPPENSRDVISILITDSWNALAPIQTRKSREKLITDTVVKTLRSGGDVLIPCDSAARVLEVLVLLESYWFINRIGAYGIYFLSATAESTLEFAKCQLEWSSTSFMTLFDHSRDNPFSFKFIHSCTDSELLDASLNRPPRVIVCGPPSLEIGFALKMFLSMADKNKNSVLFLLPPRTNTPTEKILSVVSSSSSSTVGGSSAVVTPQVTLDVKRRVPVESSTKSTTNIKESKVGAVSSKSSRQEGLEGKSASAAAKSEMKSGKEIQKPITKSDNSSISFDSFDNGDDEYGDSLNFLGISSSSSATTTTASVASSPQSDHVVESKGDNNSNSKDDEDDEEEETETETIIEQKTVQIRCNVSFVDFGGRSDGRSKKAMISRWAPKKCIIVHGSSEESSALASFCQENVCREVYVPDVNEPLTIETNVHSYKALLSDALFNSLKFHHVGDFHVASIDAVRINDEDEIAAAAANDERNAIPVTKSLTKLILPSESVKPEESSAKGKREGESGDVDETKEDQDQEDESRIASSDIEMDEGEEVSNEKDNEENDDLDTPFETTVDDSVLIGDIKLSDLRTTLSNRGFNVVLDRGMLVCNDTVCIQKSTDPYAGVSELSMEGHVNEDFYAIRQVLSEMLNLV